MTFTSPALIGAMRPTQLLDGLIGAPRQLQGQMNPSPLVTGPKVSVKRNPCGDGNSCVNWEIFKTLIQEWPWIIIYFVKRQIKRISSWLIYHSHHSPLPSILSQVSLSLFCVSPIYPSFPVSVMHSVTVYFTHSFTASLNHSLIYSLLPSFRVSPPFLLLC